MKSSLATADYLGRHYRINVAREGSVEGFGIVPAEDRQFRRRDIAAAYCGFAAGE